MTNVYFVRHAESDHAVRNDRGRPLTAKGEEDRALVSTYLEDKEINLVVSSPFKRAYDTVAPFARSKGLSVTPIEDFKERRISAEWIDDFMAYAHRQWSDFDYTVEGGESLGQVQARNVKALQTLLRNNSGRNIVVGSHGTAMSTVVNYYDNSFNYYSFARIVRLMPWIVHFQFEGRECVAMESIDPFSI